MDLQERIGSFSELSRYLDAYVTYSHDQQEDQFLSVEQAVREAEAENPWFTRSNILFALTEIARTLDRKHIEQWLSLYPEKDLNPETTRSVGVVMAGNIPLVGFHDFLSILGSGNTFIGKPSPKDKILLKCLAEILITINPEFAAKISFTETILPSCDGIIATGSNNSQRYFDYYFGNRPHIFRKNRNGAAVLSGTETAGELEKLSDDIFLYFGLGCRNVAKLFVPSGWDFTPLITALSKYSYLADHNKYANNYTYYRAMLQMNNVPHVDTGFLLLKRDTSLSSPTAMLYYDWYDNPGDLNEKLLVHKENLQCVVSGKTLLLQTVPFGSSQRPDLWEYADDVDTLNFLINLCKN